MLLLPSTLSCNNFQFLCDSVLCVRNPYSMRSPICTIMVFAKEACAMKVFVKEGCSASLDYIIDKYLSSFGAALLSSFHPIPPQYAPRATAWSLRGFGCRSAFSCVSVRQRLVEPEVETERAALRDDERRRLASCLPGPNFTTLLL